MRSTACVCMFACWLPPLFGQIDGKFSLEKYTYFVGEPIMLIFELRNTSKETLTVPTADPHSFCSGYAITVTGEEPPGPPGPSTCDKVMGGGSCAFGFTRMKPGAQRTQRYLLNSEHDLSKPGRFHVEAKYRVGYTTGEVAEWTGGQELSFAETFDIVLEMAKDSAAADAAVRPYLADLHSQDFERRQEAARAIAAVAPASAEEVLVEMLDDTPLAQFGIEGLQKLNTETARQTLASLALSTKQEWARDRAIESLGDMGDKSYLPFLVDMIGKVPGSHQGLFKAIAKLGGDGSLATLIPYLWSADAATQNQAIWALTATGSRQALALLVAKLLDPNEQNRYAAGAGLVEMTHRSPSEGAWPGADFKMNSALWQRWLLAEGGTARLYAPDQCGPIERLR